MFASWNEPALANKISDDVPAIKSLLIALLKMTDANTEDVPVDAKRLQEVTGGVQFQNYTGSTWANVGKLMHDVDMLDGKHATSSATADTIPVRDANGKLAGDILGNANTATTAASVAAGYVVPVANGGTGASDEAGARTNLGTNNAANITAGVLAIERGGTGSGTKNFVDLSTAQTIGGNKTFSGALTLNKNVLKMTVLDTLEGATDERTDTILQAISSNSDGGINVLFGGGGQTVLGAGEGKNTFLATLAGNTNENIHLIADGSIYFHANAQDYENIKTITLNTSGELSGLAKVTATALAGNLTGDVTGNVTGNCSGSSGSCPGNAATATKATGDSAGQNINTTYIKALSVSGTTITYTKGDNTTGTITTQDTNTTYSAATQSANGLMSAADKKKLDGIATSANNYSHPTSAGNKHIPSGGSSGQILRWKASGEAQWGSDNNTTYSAATTSANGLMTAAMVTKLNGIATGATKGVTFSNKGSGTANANTTKDITATLTKNSIFLVAGTYNTCLAVSGCVGRAPVFIATSTSVKIRISGSSTNGTGTIYGY